MEKDPGQRQDPEPSTTGTNLRITSVFIPNDPLLKEKQGRKKNPNITMKQNENFTINEALRKTGSHDSSWLLTV